MILLLTYIIFSEFFHFNLECIMIFSTNDTLPFFSVFFQVLVKKTVLTICFTLFCTAVVTNAMIGSMVIVLVLPSWRQKKSSSFTAGSVQVSYPPCSGSKYKMKLFLTSVPQSCIILQNILYYSNHGLTLTEL